MTVADNFNLIMCLYVFNHNMVNEKNLDYPASLIFYYTNLCFFMAGT